MLFGLWQWRPITYTSDAFVPSGALLGSANQTILIGWLIKVKQVLGYITPVRAYAHEGQIYTHFASGRLIEELAKHYNGVCLCTRVIIGPPGVDTDLPLGATNIELIAQPFWSSSLRSLGHIVGIVSAYLRTCCRSDLILVRGMCPYIGVLYLLAFIFRRPICHWIVGNPIAMLRATSRNGRIMDILSLWYAWQDRTVTKIGRWLTNGAFVCNGRELAEAYRSPRTVMTVSTNVRENEFSSRSDTCGGTVIRILFVGYIRPEKGLEYLLEAVACLKTDRAWQLDLIGSDEFPDYRRRLDEAITRRGLEQHVHWQGLIPYGQQLFDRMRGADIFVLPTLSEGTPRVLVEARANCLPCISTTVGGIPSAVTHGVDALLVPPKDAAALAEAIEKLVNDGELRRAIIRNGLVTARLQTVERFTEVLLNQLNVSGLTQMARPERP